MSERWRLHTLRFSSRRDGRLARLEVQRHQLTGGHRDDRMSATVASRELHLEGAAIVGHHHCADIAAPEAKRTACRKVLGWHVRQKCDHGVQGNLTVHGLHNEASCQPRKGLFPEHRGKSGLVGTRGEGSIANMSATLTLNVEAEVIASAELEARARHTTLSEVVGRQLHVMARNWQDSRAGRTPITDALRGAVTLPPDFDPRAALTEELQKRHGLAG